MKRLSIELSPRLVTGKKVKRLRASGVMPVHMYGKGIDSSHLQVDTIEVTSLVRSAGGNVPVNVSVEGSDGDNICFIREVQRHAVTEELLHIDFLKVDVNNKIVLGVPIILDGDAPAIDELGGSVLFNLTSLSVRCLPLIVPESIHVDVSHLDTFEKSVRVSDLEIDSEIEIMSNLETMIVRVVPPRIEEVEEEVVEDEEGLLGEDGEESVGEDGSESESSEEER